MISFTSTQRYFLYRGHTDMRKSFDGLCGLVSGAMQMNIFSGDVYIFINRPRNRMKLLIWDRSGFVIYYKRLEEGTFELPVGENSEKQMQIRWEELVLILEGISLESVRRRKRFTKTA
jgi:transposase